MLTNIQIFSLQIDAQKYSRPLIRVLLVCLPILCASALLASNTSQAIDKFEADINKPEINAQKFKDIIENWRKLMSEALSNDTIEWASIEKLEYIICRGSIFEASKQAKGEYIDSQAEIMNQLSKQQMTFSPEQMMSALKTPNISNLISFWYILDNDDELLKKVLTKVLTEKEDNRWTYLSLLASGNNTIVSGSQVGEKTIQFLETNETNTLSVKEVLQGLKKGLLVTNYGTYTKVMEKILKNRSMLSKSAYKRLFEMVIQKQEFLVLGGVLGSSISKEELSELGVYLTKGQLHRWKKAYDGFNDILLERDRKELQDLMDKFTLQKESEKSNNTNNIIPYISICLILGVAFVIIYKHTIANSSENQSEEKREKP